MFRKILVANRGEIARRVLGTCRRLGLRTVAVFSDADVGAPHLSEADEAVRLGAAPVKDSYLNSAAIVAAITETGADAVHPGYGLLSENADFARAVADAGATFIGPPPEALEAFGDKIKARAVARSVGVAPPPGSGGPIEVADLDALRAEAERVGWPVLVKAAAGGGGIGLKLARDAGELEPAARSAADRGRAAFGDARIYVEKYLHQPRHIEVQVFRDRHGRAVALGERECSVQRRHQKVVEETPSPAAFFGGGEGEARRRQLYADALRVVEAAGYEGAGTVEFVFDTGGQAYFLEVNARLQVEHPVTEAVTGLDLVELQLRVAAGEPLAAELAGLRPSGHAVEARVYAEDPSKGFLPQPGKLEILRWPELAGVRVDAGFVEGGEITQFYDPLIAKVIAHAPDRVRAVELLERALAATEIRLVGPKGPRATNLAFLRQVLGAEAFRRGAYDTHLAEGLSSVARS
jgi:3-methylcrotonyl-CoA carboxylase alpha subunit